MEGRHFIKAKIFFYSLVFFIAGVAVGNFFILPWLFLAGLVLAVMSVIIFFRNNQRLSAVLILFFILGFVRYQASLPNCESSGVICHYAGSTVSFSAQIKKVASGVGYQTLVLRSKSLKRGSALSGLVSASVPLYPEYSVGDQLTVSCRLEKYNKEGTAVGYANYLFKENIFVVCRSAQTYLTTKAELSFLAGLDSLRQYLKARLSASIREPAGAIMAGMLLNETKEIAPELNLLFSNLGLTHIVAISGSHIVVVMSIINFILMWLGISRPNAFWPATGAVIFYVLLVGSPASAVRSAIMAIIVMYAIKIGRLSSVGKALILTASLMILINPKTLLFDVGFQLSFVAVCGLAYLSPILSERMQKWPEFGPIKEIIIATLSAQIMVWPLTVYYFGNFSAISLVANVLILPMVPLLMTWGIVNLLVSALWFELGVWLGVVSYFLIGYWITVAEIMAKIPGAYWKIEGFLKILAIIAYLALGWFFLKSNYAIIKLKKKL